MATNAQRSVRILDPWFLFITIALTAACFAVLLYHVDSTMGWILFGLSAIPVYSTIYQTVMFLKAGIFHKQWTDELPLSLPSGKFEKLPGVAFLIASYQEPFEVAKMTFDCAFSVPYDGPREIIVVDNSHAVDSNDFKRWKDYVESHTDKDTSIRVVFRYNTQQGGLKPGNIDLAQSLIDTSEYVVILDVDSTLPMHSNLLARAINEFEHDDQLGVLQFHTIATNDHFNHLTGPVAVSQNTLRVKHLIRADGGFAMFLGHNAMWRKALLDANGPWLEHYRGQVMIAEDLLKSVSAYIHGYSIRYMDVPTGEWIPSSLDALESMWMRWTYGSFQVFFKYFRKIVTAKGLSPIARFDMLTYLAAYSFDSLFYPISFLWFLVYPPGRVGVLTFIIFFAPPLVFAWVINRRYTSKLKNASAKKFWDLYAGFFLIETYILAVSLRAAFNFLTGVKQGWQVTEKGLEERPSWWQVLVRNIYAVGLGAILLAALIGTWGWHSGFSVEQAFAYLPLAFMCLSLLLCVFVYGRQVRQPEASIEATTVDGYNLRNAILSKVPLFHGTNALFQHQVALSLQPKQYPAGATIWEKGDAGDALFLVANGEVEMSDGDRFLGIMGKGSFFGELSLISEKPRMATARTRTDCDFFILEKAAFLNILRNQPRVARRVAAQVRAYTQAASTNSTPAYPQPTH